LTDAERLRIVYLLITQPPNEGGAGITPKEGDWTAVESIFALHDDYFNKEWVKSWSTKYTIDLDSLTQLRNRYGEKIGFYFAFLQTYFNFLIFPAAFGAAAWFLLPDFSGVYAIINSLWTVVFVEYWQRQEGDLAVRWGVRGVSNVEHPRVSFKAQKTIEDPITGETTKYFSPAARAIRQTLQLPLAVLACFLLGGLITACFGIEIFINEVYSGPGKPILTYLPTILTITIMPQLSSILTKIATKLNDYENYATMDAYEAALIRKLFIFNFITSYVPIFLTAFVYLPFGTLLIPHLDIFQVTAKPFAEHSGQLKAPSSGFKINQSRLKGQVFYFTVTAQVVNFLLEVVVPYVKRKAFVKVKQVQNDRAAKKGGNVSDAGANDLPQEAEFLAKVRAQSELTVYDVNDDLREMVMQVSISQLYHTHLILIIHSSVTSVCSQSSGH
jgi:anoctamin-10